MNQASEKIAFICPIYDARNHFQYGLDLITSKIDFNIQGDLYFVFSDDKQECKFETMLEPEMKGAFNYLVLPAEEGVYQSQVTIKKFHGLKKLKDKYKYIYTIDSETRFIREGDFLDIGNSIWNTNNMLNANISPDGFQIMRSCYKTLGIYSNAKLKKETGNFKYNVWFNEIPIYRCDLLGDFFHWLSALSPEYIHNWMCFDYYIFAAFLIMEKNYKFNKHRLTSLGGIVEFLYLFPKKKQLKINRLLHAHWTSSDECITEHTFMRFHLDRDKGDKIYHSNDFQDKIARAVLSRYKTIMIDFFWSASSKRKLFKNHRDAQI